MATSGNGSLFDEGSMNHLPPYVTLSSQAARTKPKAPATSTDSATSAARTLAAVTQLPKGELKASFRRLYAELAAIPHVDALGIAYREDQFGRPFVEMVVLWDVPFRSEDPEMRRARRLVSKAHTAFGLDWHEALVSILSFFDASKHASHESLRAYLDGQCDGWGERARVIACDPVPHSAVVL